ncbi:unnamed protein product [Peronospora destructor]|uniref:RRM domain-containing protein n=1 Tax=Peronospora destructor TaxID=86335 RepID=A0AAV0T462_9STRA|nr:unnamed protein product [Peronospora destructor]
MCRSVVKTPRLALKSAQYATFHSDLQKFVEEQRKLQAETIEVTLDVQLKQNEQQSRERVAKLLSKIQHRITRKRSDAGQDKTLRKELVLVLDHLISAVLLSPLTTQLTLQKMDTVLKRLAGRHDDIDEYIESSYEENTSNTDSNNIVDAAEEPRVKRQRAETVPALHSDFMVKVERTAAVVAAAEAAGSDATYEVFVSNLPWGTTNEADVASYFVLLAQLCRCRFLRWRMEALYPFQGKNIHVAVHKSN